MTKICPVQTCQRQNADDATQCAACGGPLSQPAASPPPGQPGQQPAGQPEQPLWSGRASFGALLGPWILYGAAVVAVLVVNVLVDRRHDPKGGLALFVDVLALLVIVPPGLWLLVKTLYLRWATHYRLTDQRLFIQRGMLARITDQTELIRVDDVRVRQGPVQRLLGLGDVIVLSSDTLNSETVMAGIKNPMAVAEHIRASMRRLRSKGAVYVQQV